MGRDFFGNLPIVAGMHHMRGIKLLEDCEGTMTWVITGTGGDDTHDFATAAAWQGEKGFQLKTRVTGAAANDYLWASKYMDYPESGLLVVRARISPVVVANIKQINFQVNVDNGSRLYQCGLLLCPATSKVYYLDTTGAGVEITEMAFTWAAGVFYVCEFTLDLRTMTYLSAMVNGTRKDLSTIAPYDAAASSAKNAILVVGPVAVGAAAAEIYVDTLYAGEFLDT